MKKKSLAAIIAGSVVLLALGWIFLSGPKPPKRMERVRVGLFADSVCSLVYIAGQQKFFEKQGLEVIIKDYPAGVYAVDDLFQEKLDMAAAAEFVLAVQAFTRRDIRTIGTISASDSVEILARRDRDIVKPEDLKGKRLGVPKRTINDFFLSLFLSFYNIRPEEIQTIDLKPDEVVTALTEGYIDAAVDFSIYANEIRKRLGNKIISWPAQGRRDFYFILFMRDQLIKTRPDIVAGFLKALLEAETFLKKHAQEGRAIMGKILGLDDRDLMTTWSQTRFRVRLDPDLLTLMEDEGRWAIKNKVVGARDIPGYSTFIFSDGLRKIKPEAVGITP